MSQARRKFKAYQFGDIHIDLTEVLDQERKLYLFVAIDRVSKHGIDHRLTKFNHPWTDGQVERMHRTIAIVRRVYYKTHESLRTHVATFLDAYNFAKRLKGLAGLTSFERICQVWIEQPERLRLNPLHQMAGVNILGIG